VYCISLSGVVSDHVESAYIEGSALPVSNVPLWIGHNDEWSRILLDHLDWICDDTEEGAGQWEIMVHQSTTHRLGFSDYSIFWKHGMSLDSLAIALHV